jgi:hypothetical protein
MLWTPSKIYKSIKLEAKDIGGGIVATSGILKFPGVGIGQYWLSKQIPHGAAGEDGTPPSITLGPWNKDDNTVYYMEDSSWIITDRDNRTSAERFYD